MSPLRKLPTKVLCKAGLGPRLLKRSSGAPVILLYHGVTEKRSQGLANFDGKHVHVDRFRGHLGMLRRSRRIVSLEDLLESLRSGRDTDGMVAITFDDGYWNNAEHAAPVLSELRAPATFFLATGFVAANRWVWVDRLESALDSASDGVFDISLLHERVRLEIDTTRRSAVLSRIKGVLKTLPWREAEIQCRQIEAELKVSLPPPYGNYRFMTWDDVRRLRSGGFEVGAHTVNHALLSRVPFDEAQREIVESKERIATELGACSPTFCYPNGKRQDYTPQVTAFCRQHFTAALSTEQGAARGTELYELRRVIVDDRTSDELLASMVLQAS